MLLNRVFKSFSFHEFKGYNLNYMFRKNSISLKPLLKSKKFPKIEFGDFVIKLVDDKCELKKAQALRYSIFYQEKKANPTLCKKMIRLDYDKVDKFADHLIVIDKKRKGSKNKIVGTYRLLRGDIASHFGGFYTSTEFDLTKVLNAYNYTEILELGRSCVHKDYRNGITMYLLWKAIAKYIKLYHIKVLLGCVSFSGSDVMKISNELSYLRYNFSLPDEISVKSLDNNVYPACIKKNTYKSALKTFSKLPPLIKGYLRVGGRVSENFFVDHSFNTIDLCVIVKTENIDEKYMKKFLN